MAGNAVYIRVGGVLGGPGIFFLPCVVVGGMAGLSRTVLDYVTNIGQWAPGVPS